MSDENPLKSAYELAMERLAADDAEAGVDTPRELTVAQKERIAAIRQDGQAKLAELEILHRKNLAESGEDPVKRHELEEHYDIDRKRVESRVESDVARVKRGED